ncbi:hypothetical protein GCM10027092_29520 [Yaniella soli]
MIASQALQGFGILLGFGTITASCGDVLVKTLFSPMLDATVVVVVGVVWGVVVVTV